MKDYQEIPAGFAMALAQNETAVNAYAMMTPEAKQAILNKAHNAQTRQEMQQIVADIAAEG